MEIGAPKGEIRALSTERLDEEIGELAAHIAAATARFLLLVAEFDRRRAYSTCGFGECSSWLSWRCSLSARAARDHVRVARALEELPRIRSAFLGGRLSYSKVRAVTKIASEATEETLLSHALHATASQLERIVGSYRRVQTLNDANAAEERRYLSYQWEEDGTLSFRGRLAPEEGAVFLRALEAGRETVWEEERGSAEPRQVTNADAFAAVSEASLASDEARRSGGDHTQIVVHIDPQRAQLAEGPTLCDAAARRLACDASLVGIAEGDGEPLSVGRKTRTIPPALRRALRSRDKGCRFPGCLNHRFTDAHHIRHWADGGETKLSNLLELCRRHHRLLHEAEFTLERSGDGFVFRDKWGKAVPACPELGRGHPAQIALQSRRHRLEITKDTCFPRSAGARMDLGLTIEGLFWLEERSAAEP